MINKTGVGIFGIEFLDAMGFRTYIIETQHRAISKYSHLRRKVASKFIGLQDRVLSQLHHAGKKSHGVINAEINASRAEKSSMEFLLGEELTRKDKEESEELLRTSNENQVIMNKRPEGSQLIKIIIIKGKIVEKEYITIEGDRISMKFE